VWQQAEPSNDGPPTEVGQANLTLLDPVTAATRLGTQAQGFMAQLALMTPEVMAMTPEGYGNSYVLNLFAVHFLL
jgi:hypothetical protein